MCVTMFELAWWYTHALPSFSMLHEKNKKLVKHGGTDLDQPPTSYHVSASLQLIAK